MKQTISLAGIALACAALLPAQAAVVHKWVDANGHTHYSDAAPVAEDTQVTRIEVIASSPASAVARDHYYSIKNQWERVHKERLRSERIKLEQARQKAQLRQVEPQVVYINESRDPVTVVVYARVFHRHHRPGHYHSGRGSAPTRYRYNSVYATTRHARGQPPVGLATGPRLLSY
jgi:hypothetical protein